MNCRRYIATFTALLLFAVQLPAQTDSERKNIQNLCGCFDIDFKYAETFSPIDSYKLHEPEKAHGRELVLPIVLTDKKIVLQHLLIIQDTMIIKHWREDWEYQATALYEFTGNKTWTKQDRSADQSSGVWTQTVWEVDDEPRYQGFSKWITNDGKTYWESTAPAPLPRREYTKRNDYNIMLRHNRIIVTDSGWVHEQDNNKILRADSKDILIAEEKGFNTYHRIDETNCKAAKIWWEKNGAFWNVVRNEWQTAIKDKTKIAVKSKGENQQLNDALTALWRDWSAKKISNPALAQKVKQVLNEYL